MTMNRAYSTIVLKAVDEDSRTFEGIASTPTADLMSDIVEPKGAEYKLPFPLLMQHDHNQPIGHVTAVKITSAGIQIKAKLVKIEEAGKLKDRLDEAWQLIKSGLVRGLSIGFMPIESARIEGTYGYRYIKWLWHELSAVVVAANTDCSIQTIKSIDQKFCPAASGRAVYLNPPGVSGTPNQPAPSGLSFARNQGNPMNIQEQIKSFEAKRAADAARMETLMSKAAGEGRGLDATEAEEYETANTEVKSTDTHLQRLRELEKVMVSKAAPVNGQSQNGGSEARQHNLLQLKPKLEKGQEFARFALCLAAAKGNHMQAYEIAKSRFADSPQLHTILKAAVAAGTTTDPTWAGPLLEYNQFAGDFVEYLRPMTIVGKFGQGAIPSLRRIPFNVHIRGQTSGGDGYWVGQGAPKPVTKFDFNDTYLSWAKVANIAVLTEDMIRFSNPSADMLVRQALAEALIARLDIDFVDPNKALVANVSPASITNGAITVPSTGTDLEAARVDANLAMNEFIERNISLTSGVWIMSNSIALALSQMRNALGQKEHPDLTMNGGTYEGLPVITSQYVAANSGGSQLILASADNIWLADDGQVVIKTSNEASLQMLDNPTNNAASATATTMVSMFQTNSIAMLAERWINWQRRRDGAVVVVTNANYSVTA